MKLKESNRAGGMPQGRARSISSGLLTALLVCLASFDAAAHSVDAPPRIAIMPPEPLASSQPDTALHELERIERMGLADSDANFRKLGEIAAAAATDSPERLEALSQQITLAGHRRDGETVDRMVQALQQWPEGPLRRAAEIVAAYGRAALLRESGDLAGARRAAPELYPALDSQVPAAALIRAYFVNGRIAAETSALDRALACGAQALRLAEQTGSHWRRAGALNELAWLYLRAQQKDRAEQTSAESLREAQADPAPDLLFHIYTNRSILFEDDPVLAPQLDAQALSYARLTGDPQLLAQAVSNSADYYLRTRQFRRALELATEGYALARSSHTADSEITSLSNTGLAKIGLRRLEEGKSDVRTAVGMFESRGSVRYAAELWLEFGNALEAAGDYPAAIDAYQNYRRQFDPLMQDDTRKAIVEEQERFEDENRAREIELLDRDNRLKAEGLRARELEARLWLTLSACVVASLVLVGIAYRRVRRTNEALARVNASLKTQSEHDALTGLANRRYLQSAIRQWARQGKFVGTIFLVDIDQFKWINDQFGHFAGDAALVEVARRLRGASREGDLIVRWGGEEFIIVCRTPEPAVAEALARRLLEHICASEVNHGERRISVTASIGYASFPLAPYGLELHWERAIDLVDMLMYLAKAHGRNRAYGLVRIDARTEDEFVRLATDLDDAAHEGRIALQTMDGPPPAPVDEPVAA